MQTTCKLLLSIMLSVMLGTTATFGANYFMLTDLGTSAEMISLGNIEGFSDSASSIFENPASLYRVGSYSASAFSATVIDEVTYQNVALAYNTGNGVIGLGYMSNGVNDIPITTRSGSTFTDTGDTFNYTSNIIRVGYQYTLTDQLSVGASVSSYSTEIYKVKGTGFGVDVGAVYSFSDLTISLVGHNIVPQKVTYTKSDDPSYSGEEDLPLQVVLGVLYPWADFRIMGQVKYDGTNSLVSLGASYSPDFLNMVTINAGYKEYSVLDTTANNIALGVGLDLYGFKLDYAFEKSDHFEFDNTSYLGLQFNM